MNSMKNFFTRNGNLFQKLKPIIIERASYCVQIEINTKTVKIIKFTKISHSVEHIIIDFSEWREHESKKNREFRTEVAMSKSPWRKRTCFHMIQIENILMNL